MSKNISIVKLVLFFTALFALTMLLQQITTSQAATPTLSITGSGSDTTPGGETTYRLELLNHTDQIVYDGVLTATLPAGFSYISGTTIVLGEGWPMDSHEPTINGQTLTWGPYHLPAAGITAHNPFGIHTIMDCDGDPNNPDNPIIPALHLEGAKILAGSGGYITQLFYPIDTTTTGPSQCAINYVTETYARNLIPILRLQGHRVNGIFQAPDPGPNGDYAQIAQAYANYVSGLPRTNTTPLYIEVWNEPDLWIEWSGKPNATQYARFFVAVSKAIRNLGDARIRIVNGALTPGNTTFVDQMLRVPGFRDAFDVWASHCYPYNHPAWYNSHNGAAKYGAYAIDCYLEELAVIKKYGRTNVKVILTETGYKLGEDLYDFEGFPTINESNRANYIVDAYTNYWLKWPEIVAVTPFELTDSGGLWDKFDWVYPIHPTYPPHLQYTVVKDLPKPAGQTVPHGWQVIFKTSVSTDVVTGTYSLLAGGSERDGNTVAPTAVATMTVRDPVPLQYTYLPIIMKPLPGGGAFYSLDTQPAPLTENDGAIIPTNFLTAPQQVAALTTAPQESRLPLPVEPLAMAVDEAANLAGVLLADGHLQIVNLITLQAINTLFVGDSPQTITAGPTGTGQVFVALDGALLHVDMQQGQILNQVATAGRWRGLAWDANTRQLFAANATTNSLAVFDANLRQVDTLPLPHQPDQLLFDTATSQIYVAFPAAGQVVAIDSNTLKITAQHMLMGGPIVDMALDTGAGRLVVLNALAPTQRGITILKTPDLQPLAVVGGSETVPLRIASALAIGANNDILIAEAAGLLRVDMTRLTTNTPMPIDATIPGNGLFETGPGNTLVGLDIQHPGLFRLY